MFAGLRQRRILSPFAVALAIAALAVRVLIPVGFMPGQAHARDHAAFPLIVCSSHGAVETLALPGGLGSAEPSKQGKAHDGGSPCVFSSLALGAGPQPHPLIVSAPWSYVQRPLGILTSLRPGRGLIAPPPPQTGPPILL